MIEALDFDIPLIWELLVEGIVGLLVIVPAAIAIRKFNRARQQAILEPTMVEQKAWERMQELEGETIAATEFLAWMAEVERGRGI